MKRIYKYTISAFEAATEDGACLALPHAAQVLSFQNQHGAPAIWAIVDDEDEGVKWSFRLIGTGHPFNGEAVLSRGTQLDYIGTAQFNEGHLVLHCFGGALR